MSNPPSPFRLMPGSYPGDWGVFLEDYENGDRKDLDGRVRELVSSKKNHRQQAPSLGLSPVMANAMELMDMAIGNDDPALLDAVLACHPDALLERSVEEISPSSTSGLCSMVITSPSDLPIRATWLELACFRLSIHCVQRLLDLGALEMQPEERMGWPAGLAMWEYAESRIWRRPGPMLRVLQALHSRGADLNRPDPWGRLPLCLLSRSAPPSQTMRVCASLMQMGALALGPLGEDGSVRNERPYRNCPALENTRQGNLPAMSCLLSLSPREVVSARSDGGETALHVLAMGAMASVEPARNIALIARELIDLGCDPDAKNGDGLTPMEYAVGQDNLLELGQELHARGARLESPDERWPLLFSACACQDPSASGRVVASPSIAWIKWLISSGCSPNTRILGRSVIHYVMQSQPRVMAVVPFRRAKASPTAAMEEIIAAGWHPLASDSGSIEDMIMLSSPGPSLDSEKGWGRLENRDRIAFLVRRAIDNGWLDDPRLPAPSREFAALMGSTWSRHLLERGTSSTDDEQSGQRRL